tara:strand:- start:6909 stop:7361 length:453 start_codon:yes stop_codon:yes gene_type:complete
MKKKSQKQKVKEYLEAGNSLTAVESFERGWGMRLASIVNLLKKDGLDIKTEMVTNRFGTSYAKYKLKAMKTSEDIAKEKEQKAKLLLKMKKYDNVQFANDLSGNRYFKIGYWKPIDSNHQYYIKQHSKLNFEEVSVWDDDCGYKYWYSLK